MEGYPEDCKAKNFVFFRDSFASFGKWFGYSGFSSFFRGQCVSLSHLLFDSLFCFGFLVRYQLEGC
jgi:hypothetical protein